MANGASRLENSSKAEPRFETPPAVLLAKGGKVGTVMHEFKHGQLHSGSKKGPLVRSRAQAVAIGLSEARKAGQSVKAKGKKK
jgi:hypothetical protein